MISIRYVHQKVTTHKKRMKRRRRRRHREKILKRMI
jgi:hypothetical protein